ncbi:MAG: hypothetical protein H7Z75_21730 [Ferruginibacter sp.]|nr:hypothetical protein [Cytophagales bacterium]
MKNACQAGWILLLLFFDPTAGHAQTALDKASASACECAKKVSNQGDAAARHQAMQQCIQEAFLQNLSAFNKEYQLDLDDERKVEALGMELGKKLVVNCASFLEYSLATIQSPENAVEKTATGSVEGKFKRLEVKDFVYFVVTNEKEKEDAFLWLHPFQGSEDIFREKDRLKGKTLRIEWQEYEAYLPKANGYHKIKEIISIEIID